MSKKRKKNIAKTNKKKQTVKAAVNQDKSNAKEETKDISQKVESVKPEAKPKAEKKVPTKKADRNTKPGIIGRAFNFLKEVKNELKKVTWLTPDELMKSTGIVAGIVTISTFFTWVVDSGFGSVAAMIIGAK